MDAEIELRYIVLRGGFRAYQDIWWKSPSWKSLVFISTTSSDTQAEKNILFDILKISKRLVREFGIQVSFSEMRRSTRDTTNHESWKESSRELRRCKEESMGVYFISLQSEKWVY